MSTRFEKNAFPTGGIDDQDTRVIACPGCGLVDIDPCEQMLCADCAADVLYIEEEQRQQYMAMIAAGLRRQMGGDDE